MKHSIKILVADDHPMLLKGVVDELEVNGYKKVYAANNGAEALNILTQDKIDLAILDIEMPLLSGFEVIKKYTQAGNSGTRFIVLTSHKEKGFVIKAKKFNISGYILKDEPFEELDQCIQMVIQGKEYFSKTFDQVFNNQVSPVLKKIKLLTPSERTIVRMIVNEHSSREIGAILSISHRTVQKHRANIIEKLGIEGGSDALIVWSQENKEVLLSI